MYITSVSRTEENLADLITYKNLKSDLTQAIRNDVLSTLDFLYSAHQIDQRASNYLTPQELSCTSSLHGLPKVYMHYPTTNKPFI